MEKTSTHEGLSEMAIEIVSRKKPKIGKNGKTENKNATKLTSDGKHSNGTNGHSKNGNGVSKNGNGAAKNGNGISKNGNGNGSGLAKTDKLLVKNVKTKV